MISNAPSLDLVEFIETKILPKYAEFDRAHNLEHVTRVIRRSLDLVKITGADINMVYTIAAYHDVGMSGPRAVHHITGGKILSQDARLKGINSLVLSHFFIIRFSHPYMTTGKTIALTIRTFVGKLVSLFFNMLLHLS